MVETADRTYNDKPWGKKNESPYKLAEDIVLSMTKLYSQTEVYEDRVNDFIRKFKERTGESLEKNLLVD